MHSGWVVKVADCGSTGHGFESTLAPLITSIRALNKFSLNLQVPVHLAVLVGTSLAGVIPKSQRTAYKPSSLAVTVVKCVGICVHISV